MFVNLISTNFSKRSPLKFGFLDVYELWTNLKIRLKKESIRLW